VVDKLNFTNHLVKVQGGGINRAKSLKLRYEAFAGVVDESKVVQLPSVEDPKGQEVGIGPQKNEDLNEGRGKEERSTITQKKVDDFMA